MKNRSGIVAKRLLYVLRKADDVLLDIFLPKRCVLCGRTMNIGKSVCICPICKRNAEPTQRHVVDDRYCFEEAIGILPYENQTKAAILNFKFHAVQYYCKTFAKLIYENIRERSFLNEDVLITCVPIHPLRKRGYNQSYLIAKDLAAFLQKPLEGKILVKIKHIKPVSSMPASQRRLQVRGAFGFDVRYSVLGKTVLLVDDIFTTGSSVNECARLLKINGAVKVIVVTACYARQKKEEE